MQIHWHSKDELPSKSGEYLVFTTSNSFMSTQYSDKHKLWNCYDSFDENYIKEHNDNFGSWVQGWAEYDARAVAAAIKRATRRYKESSNGVQ